MTLTVHHLRRSQSERIVWLCEELGLDYTLEVYDRDPVTILAPADYKALHPMQAAPVVDDGDVRLAESGAIVDWLLARYGGGRFVVQPTEPDFARYGYWLHFANANLQALMGRLLLLARLEVACDDPTRQATRGRLERALAMMDTHLATARWLAGDAFTAADIMTVFTLSTMRLFTPLDLAPYPQIRTYLARVGERPAYRRAMAKGDPGFAPLLT